MDKVTLKLKNGESISVKKGSEFFNVVKENNLDADAPVVLGILDGYIHELTYKIYHSGTFDVVDIRNSTGIKVYERTLQFVLIKAVLDVYPDSRITIEHSLGNGIFGEIHKQGDKLNEEDIEKIKIKMKEIIDKDVPIKKISVSKKKAIEIFESYGMEDKVKLLHQVHFQKLKLYELEGRYDYFYGAMAYSTGILKNFDLKYYKPGFILMIPSEKETNKLPKFIEQKKLSQIFYETEKWGDIIGVGDVGSLNNNVKNGESVDMIRVSEALHEKKIAYIADMIYAKKDIKVVLIAGPSSSGKTTFARRLGIQLRVNGMIPVPISLDDYFVDRAHTPKDENGNYDFESIYALDIKLFNENLNDLMKGKETVLPIFNFKTGQREWNEKSIRLPENGVIIIEGIHGLNEMLTPLVPRKNKFKIYISALTQLNLDSHNRISTTDTRKIRRIVRDYLSRGYGAEETLKMWPSIKKGEEKNIFVFQEEADVMFNSSLVYELCVLRKYALAELSKIKASSSVYYEAKKLRSFLNFFKDVDMKFVPDNSILREFVGGSCFYKY
ncbi:MULTISPECIES: nucleoside kinase [Clostridium]|uniref:nucleoside kinase n=1 Tax=Clostridium TaxID=1485 RepID=UPI00069CF29A|nr:nucleoside kinase [Clostridium sp. DMHC 10]KOF56928.1 ATPase AAA [Clostridium sp. DMHC 10]MCD2346578.1 nucleoside kinase [Clostridium guangxiense]